jgi:hypothetical protein
MLSWAREGEGREGREGRRTCGGQAQHRRYLGEDQQLPTRFGDCATSQSEGQEKGEGKGEDRAPQVAGLE